MNILINESYVAKVCDFGISKEIKNHMKTMQKTSDAKHGANGLGTLNWSPPEDKFSLKSDVYSFGLVMWEALTGKYPFFGYSIGKLIREVHLKAQRPPIPEYTNPKYANLMQECWSADKEERPMFDIILKRLEALLNKTRRLSNADTRKELMSSKTARLATPWLAAPTLNLKEVMSNTES
eukprot:TRINITY_DN6163_c0_g2_i1.p1 TRINITY_DN6163_c0_g2~~TRINITY_DN6163_c0_g2_i1.p1  ORF type:complete len:180 (+),score=19.84 TRINITY_DN6163_c0_g2_i1:127-666(+)